MKRNYLYLFIMLLFAGFMRGQSTETFETESVGSSSFTDNGKVFNITSQAPAIFDVFLYSGGGWNGTAIDNRFIDNSGSTYFNTPVQFTISAANGAPFTLKKMYLFLSKSDLGLNVSGTVTITGKLAGATVFTASASSPFTTSMGVNNGFTLFNMATFAGANNAATAIDQYVITTTGNIAYVALDAMNWDTACVNPAITTSPTGKSICAAGTTSFDVVASNTTAYQWQVNTGSGFANITNGGVYSGATTATLTITSATAGMNGYSYRAVATGNCGPAAVSSSATLTVNSAPNITQNPFTSAICEGDATLFFISASGATSYQWQVSTDNGANWSNVTNGAGATGGIYSGATSSVLIINNAAVAMNGYKYRAKGSGSCTPTATSSPATFTVNANVTYYEDWDNDGYGNAYVTNISCTGAPAGFVTNNLDCNDDEASAYTGAVEIPDDNIDNDCDEEVDEPCLLAVSVASSTNVSCNGGTNGTGTVSASGVAPYIYSWAPYGGTAATATGLTAGTYTVTVTDANFCEGTVEVIITQPSALTATQSHTDVSCNGGTNGTASVVASGGAGGYTYSWFPSGGTGATTTGRAAGSYTVTITDANGCSIQKNFTINAPAALTATQSHTDVSCNGGSNGTASVVASGGAGGYTYSWFPSGGTGATTTGRSAGNYNVIITDANGCAIQKNFTINAPAALQVSQNSMTTIACNGGATGSATVNTPTGGTGPYTYDWLPGNPTGDGTNTITGLTAGAYYCIVTDANGCTATSFTFNVTQPSVLSATATIVSQVTSSSAIDGSVSVSASGGTPGYTYLWSNGATTSTVTGLGTGTYFCIVTDAYDCVVTTSSVELTVPIVAPIAYAVTGGGIYCQGSTGVAIGLENSELGVAYQLKRDGNNVGDVVNGTGSSLSFGNFNTAGAYNVVGTNVDNESTTPMTGEAVVSVVNLGVTIAEPMVMCTIPNTTLLATLNPFEGVGGAFSGFAGAFAPANWTFLNTNTDGSVTPNATTSISILGGNTNGGGSGITAYSIVVPASGTLSFNWNYSTIDEAFYDYPELVNDDVVTLFTDYNRDGSSTQSGNVSVPVVAGTTVTLRMLTVDNGAGAATVVVSAFSLVTSGPQPVLSWTASNGGFIETENGVSANVSASGTYTLTATVGDCTFSDSVVVDFNNPTMIETTWNGTTWSNGTPDVNYKAIIDGDLVVETQLIACELEITANGSFTVLSNGSTDLVRKVTNNATAADFVIQNNAALVQKENVQNIGPVTVNVTSFPLYRQDYTLWSSPVENHNLRIFSPQTIFNRFKSYDTALGTNGDYVQEIFTTEDVANKTFATGKGYLIRSPNNWEEYVEDAIPGIAYEGVFKGVPQNGTVTIPLSTANTGMNLVGNPYPSTIDIPMFFNMNPGIEETIYYWRKRNGATGSGYATYNSMGFVSVQPGLTDLGTTLEAMPLLSPGQGFFVKSTGATALNFNNQMRDFMGNGVFLKSTPVEKHRFWLNLSNSTNTIGQALIGYTTGATQAVDSGYDSSYFNDSPVALTSLINGGEYSIQGLGLPFDAASSVALGFKTNVAGSYTISLSNFDGLFVENQDIYIKDNLTGIVHNVKESAYSFVATEGIANDRFEVVYQAMLGTDNPDMDINKVMVYKQEKDIYINAASIVIQKVELYDIRGSLIQVLEDVNQTTATLRNLNIANQVVLVKITSVENKIITKKIVY